MNKETRNTLVYDFIGTAFCLVMAFALILMFSGCSDSESKQPVGFLGGAEEETGIYALSGRAGAIMPKLMKIADTTGEIIDSTGYEGSLFAPRGTVVSVYELDSLTLDTTGRFFVDTIDNDSGRFVFEEMELSSPYILIVEEDPPVRVNERGTIKEKYNTYNAIVNMQNITNVSVNALTSAKVPLLREYVTQGKSFAEANKMAEREVLKQLGIYEELGSFEELFDEKSELAYAEALIRQTSVTERQLIDFDISMYVEDMLYIPSVVIADSGTEAEEYYQNKKKMTDYQVGLLAEENGIGQCTEARENEMAIVLVGRKLGDSVAIVCHSGKWTLGLKKLEYTKGTMTDNRDGQTYKTVTYNIDGVSQTWMAQNLNFEDTVSAGADSALNAKSKWNAFTQNYDRSGKTYGRFYTWLSAMNIGEDDIKVYSIDSVGDTVFLEQQDSPCVPKDIEGKEFCIYMRTGACGSDSACIAEVKLKCDSLYGVQCTEGMEYGSFGITEYMADKNKDAYQGICPEGWRIPTVDDWNSLLQMMGEHYGVNSKEAALALFGEDATGFGIKRLVDNFEVDLENQWIWVSSDNLMQFVVADALVRWVTLQSWRTGFTPDKVWFDYDEDLGYGSIGDTLRAAAVRCIKN